MAKLLQNPTRNLFRMTTILIFLMNFSHTGLFKDGYLFEEMIKANLFWKK